MQTGASNAGGVGRNRDSQPTSDLTVTGRCCKRGRKLQYIAGIVSGGVDCRRRRRNVYDKKPQRYAKENRKAHLKAHS